MDREVPDLVGRDVVGGEEVAWLLRRSEGEEDLLLSLDEPPGRFPDPDLQLLDGRVGAARGIKGRDRSSSSSLLGSHWTRLAGDPDLLLCLVVVVDEALEKVMVLSKSGGHKVSTLSGPEGLKV